MSTTHDIEPFTGSGWKECSAFIQRVRAAAWKEGKIRDPDWMADLASLHFSDDALAWYCRLPPDVQGNWHKLQAALAERWAPSDSDGRSEPPNVPVAAAAAAPTATPSDSVKKKIDSLDCGILRAYSAQRRTLYVQADPSRRICTLTDSTARTLRVRFNPRSDSQVLECDGTWRPSWVAAHWDPDTLDLSRGSTQSARLTVVEGEELKPPPGLSGPFQLASCRTATRGEVTFFWKEGTTEISLAVFYGGINLQLAPDSAAYYSKYSGMKPVTLHIQKVDQ